jgi:hypothetical protein
MHGVRAGRQACGNASRLHVAYVARLLHQDYSACCWPAAGRLHAPPHIHNTLKRGLRDTLERGLQTARPSRKLGSYHSHNTLKHQICYKHIWSVKHKATCTGHQLIKATSSISDHNPSPRQQQASRKHRPHTPHTPHAAHQPCTAPAAAASASASAWLQLPSCAWPCAPGGGSAPAGHTFMCSRQSFFWHSRPQ